MKKKLKTFFLSILFILFFSLTFFYVGVSLYYDTGYSFGTWINGHYCTGMSPDEVNELLKSEFSETSLKFDFVGLSYQEILLSDIDYSIDYYDSLNEIYSKREKFKWYKNIFTSDIYKELEPAISYDESKLKLEILKLKIFEDYGPEAIQYSEIRFSTDYGYSYYEMLTGLLEYDTVLKLSKEVLNDSFCVKVDDSYYVERELSDEIIHNREVWDDIKVYLSTEIIYDMGSEEIFIDAPLLSTFIEYDSQKKEFKKNTDGSLYINEKLVLSYIDDICQKYNTYRKSRTYTTYSGEEKQINLSTYGTELNVAAEEKYFLRAVKEGISERHIPAYIHKPFSRGLNDIGTTFIEVDLTNQILLYVVDNEIYLQCDIVSGKPSAGNATPEVLAYVVKKNKNTYLRGADYVSFVNFWMPFYGGNGFHDASWQRKFGGNRYINYGSHGCINMRYDDAKTLYDKVEVGTPVIVYK